jgi:hypothetical protein
LVQRLQSGNRATGYRAPSGFNGAQALQGFVQVIISVALPTDHNAEMVEIRSQRSDSPADLLKTA